MNIVIVLTNRICNVFMCKCCVIILNVIRCISSNEFLITVDGKAWLSQKWNLCSPLTNDGDVSTLKQWVSELYVNLAMINYPYPANFLTPLPGYPVKVIFSNI